MVLIFFLLLGVAEEDYRQVVLLGFRLCCKQPRLLCTVFTEDLYGRINLGHLCGFFFFVSLFTHKLCIRRNFALWVACKFLTTSQILRIWHTVDLICFFWGLLLLLIHIPASLQTTLFTYLLKQLTKPGSCCRARTAPQIPPLRAFHGKGMEKASPREAPSRNACSACRAAFCSARRWLLPNNSTLEFSFCASILSDRHTDLSYAAFARDLQCVSNDLL